MSYLRVLQSLNKALIFISASAILGMAGDSITLRTGAYSDIGQLVNGIQGENNRGLAIENLLLPRIGVTLTTEILTEEGLRIQVGAGGLFWYPYPVSPGQWWARRLQFGPGISEASFQYDFWGDSEENPATLSLKGGLINYKYNADAQNLGEYLLRSEVYPGLVTTGGWSFLNSADYQAIGFQVHLDLLHGALSNDFLLLTDIQRPPLFDMSPTWVGTWHLSKGIEIGAGVSLHRFIAIQPSMESPKAIWGSGAQGNTYLTPNPSFDSDSLVSRANPRYIQDTTRFYTFQGTKLMARASLNAKELIPALQDGSSPLDWKVYAEAAVLGVKNYPYYYDQITQRIPVMFGANFPTFRLLDLLAFQFEYYRNPWSDNSYNFYSTSTVLPVPYIPPGDYAKGMPATVQVSRDNWKWSLNLVRTLTKGLKIQAQCANDHMRLIDVRISPTALPMTQYGKHWYYIVRLQWGI
jgi:hypothetical protein